MTDQPNMDSALVPQSPFERTKQSDPDGNEFWSARDLMEILEYTNYRSFKEVLLKAQLACENSEIDPSSHFCNAIKMVQISPDSKREMEDMHLSRYACYLVVQSANASAEVVAQWQSYLAIQTRRQEIADEINDSQNHGYKGLYDGLSAKDIRKKKNLDKNQHILDHMGATELAANLFCSTQAKEKLRRDNVQGKETAIQVHFEAGQVVRRAIAELGGTMPENLPTVTSIKTLEQSEKKRLAAPKKKQADDTQS